MIFNRHKRSIILFLLLSTLGFSKDVYALTCQQVRELTNYYFKYHFSFSEFNDELSRRTLDMFLRSWDPGKVYFLQSDVERFEKEYATKLDDAIKGNDCKPIDDIISVYGTRFKERLLPIADLIKQNHDFTVDEYLEFDRKKMPWAKTNEELAERWRKRIKFQMLQLKESVPDMKKVREKMTKRIDLMKKRYTETTSDQVYGIFLNAFASALDPHSSYMAPDELEDFRINTRLALEGIGAVLRSEDGFTTIQTLVPGGAAALSGSVRVDDKIIAVAQGNDTPVDVIDMDLRDVVKLIRGPRATIVKLTILRDDKGANKQIIVPLKREKVQLTDKAAKSKIVELKSDDGKSSYKVGIISLPSFYIDFEGRQNRLQDFRSSSADMIKEIANLKAAGMNGLVVDLRNNGGGSLDEAVNVSGLFIKSGPIVQIQGQNGGNLNDKDESVAWDGPLAVLINRQSASASEIFAGAIQDYGRGVIVGDTHTFGKGTVQNLNEISEKLGAVKVTISKFYRPSGSSTQMRGIESDVVFPDIMDEIEIGEKFYDYAMPWDKIKSTEFRAVNMVDKSVAKLKEASAKRIAEDQLFKEISAEIKKWKENEKDRNRVSLKEKPKVVSKKDEKKNGKKGKKSNAEDPEASLLDDSELALGEDAHMQEALKVTTDLIRTKAGQPLVKLSIPELEQKLVAKQKGKADDSVKPEKKK